MARDQSSIHCNQWSSPKSCSTLHFCECTFCLVVLWIVLAMCLTFTVRHEGHVCGRPSFAVFIWWDCWQYVSVDSASFEPLSSALEYSHPCCFSNGRLRLRLLCVELTGMVEDKAEAGKRNYRMDLKKWVWIRKQLMCWQLPVKIIVSFYLHPQCDMFRLDRHVLVHEDIIDPQPVFHTIAKFYKHAGGGSLGLHGAKS